MAEQISLLTEKKKASRILTFDLETLRFADEVGGWQHIHDMGMACGVVYDSLDQKFRTYFEKDAADLAADLRNADLVVGFNHIKFDYKVLSAYTSFDLTSLPSFDILIDIKERLGHRLKLNTLVAATLGDQKSADGLQSLRWVKEGRMDLVADYCQKDVEVTWRLFEHGIKNKEVQYENYGSMVSVPVDWDPEEIIRRRG